MFTDIENLFSAIFEAANRVALRTLQTRFSYKKEELDLDFFAKIAKPIYEKSIDRMLDEWKPLVEVPLPDEAYRRFINAQAAELGTKVAEDYYEEDYWRSVVFDD